MLVRVRACVRVCMCVCVRFERLRGPHLEQEAPVRVAEGGQADSLGTGGQ